MRRALAFAALLVAVFTAGCSAATTGITGTVSFSGGTQPSFLQNQTVEVEVYSFQAPSHLVTTFQATEGVDTTIALAPGSYRLAIPAIRPCQSINVDVIQGQLSPFDLECSIR